jgi:Holliday junction resolvase RusA-like endonuclease
MQAVAYASGCMGTTENTPDFSGMHPVQRRAYGAKTPCYYYDMSHLSLATTPLSVNKAWQGKRFKTDEYIWYEREIDKLVKLNPPTEKIDGLLEIHFTFHLKYHKTTDYDNLLKPLQDILQKCGVIEDDRFIYQAVIAKRPETPDGDMIEIDIFPFSLPE